MDVTTKLFYGLTGPRCQRSITSRVPIDYIIDEHRTKIQGMRIDLKSLMSMPLESRVSTWYIGLSHGLVGAHLLPSMSFQYE